MPLRRLLATTVLAMSAILCSAGDPVPTQPQAAAESAPQGVQPRGGELSPLAAAFDGAQTLRDVEKQLSFGPRIPGSKAHGRQVEWMVKELTAAGWEVEVWEGGMWTPSLLRRQVPIYNVIARWKTDRPRRLFFSAHFDTRPYADAPASPPAERNLPVPGANDGASGVAVLLGMARAIAKHPPQNVGVFLVFHDCEDLGSNMPTTGRSHPYKEFAVGAERLSNAWKPHERFEAGVNLDLVGEKASPLFMKEQYSLTRVPELVGEYWAIGEKRFPELFSSEVMGIVTDDHVPYLINNLPVINVIDLDYAEWHTVRDNLDAVSAETMQKTGIVALEFISQRDSKPSEKP